MLATPRSGPCHRPIWLVIAGAAHDKFGLCRGLEHGTADGANRQPNVDLGNVAAVQLGRTIRRKRAGHFACALFPGLRGYLA